MHKSYKKKKSKPYKETGKQEIKIKLQKLTLKKCRSISKEFKITVIKMLNDLKENTGN